MARKLEVSTHACIRCMIESGNFALKQIAVHNQCSIHAVKNIKRNLREFGSTTRPARRGGRPSTMTPLRCAMPSLPLSTNIPELYLEKMVVYLWNEFGVAVTKSSVGRTLGSE